MVVIMNFVDELLSIDVLLYACGSLAGWWAFAGARALPSDAGPRPTVAVVIPARDEEHNIGEAVSSIVPFLRQGDEIVVVDDHSTDATASRARQAGARVVAAPEPIQGWMGKPHACWAGVGATSAEIILFVDADVRVRGVDVIDRLATLIVKHPAALISVQPWHVPGSYGERLAAMFNVVAIMGSGAGRLWARTRRALVFGPVLACRRSEYLRAGGHANETVRGSVIEDIALGKLFDTTKVFLGDSSSITFRMYPLGVRSMINGFTKNMARGASRTRVIDAVAAVAWVTAMIGALFTSPLLYLASVVQIVRIQRRVGNFGVLTAVTYPLSAAVFVGVVVRSALAVLGIGRIHWAGRRLP